MTLLRITLATTVAFAIAGCSAGEVRIHAIDEAGAPVSGAEVTAGSRRFVTNSDGIARIPWDGHPELVTVGADGFCLEPATIGSWDVGSLVDVRLFGASGRTVIHSSGDLMLGRRYEEPDEGAPLIDPDDDGSSAQAVVSDIAPAFSAADLVTVNLETVVADLPDDAAYPGKRWLLQTPPAALGAFGPLGVNVADLANNHQRDWLDDGVARTLGELDAAGIAHVGSGRDAVEAAEPLLVERDGLRIGVMGFTSVDGDYVNGQYPLDDEPAPDPIPDDTFKWEARSWGEPSLGVPVADRRIGSAWAAIAAVEPSLSEAEVATLWASATEVYPELQDWVARRGHAGAQRWTDAAPDAIAALAAQTDLLIVQLHMGYQFSTAPDAGVKAAAHAAIDAGADLVVCHHPHVLQGFEWYHGRLIAWSLGNFAFDQNFLATFRSAFLRTIWEGSTLVDARIVPMMLDRYRPVPVADGLARDIGRLLWEGSLFPATSDRASDGSIRAVASDEARDPLGFVWEHGTARITPELPDVATTDVTVPEGGIAPLPRDALVRRRLDDAPADGVQVGRDVLAYGRFEDEDTDEDTEDPPVWTWTSDDVAVDTRSPLDGGQALELRRDQWNADRVSARMIARIPMYEHRLYDDVEGTTPLDGEATWSVRLLTRREGDPAELEIRVALYHFDDLDATEDPVSTPLGERTVTLTPDAETGESILDLGAIEPVDGLVPNAGLVYVSLMPPEKGATIVHLDDLSLIEWRDAAAEPEGWAALDWVRSAGGATTLHVDTLPF